VRSQQATVYLGCHRLEKRRGNLSDEVDLICVLDREFCFFVKVHATCDGIDPDWVVPQKRRRYEGSFEPCVDVICHIFFSELEEVAHNPEGVYDGRFGWVDESEKDLEGLSRLYDMDNGWAGVTLSRLTWLRDRKHVMKDG
jgi:hypothetical protein